MKSIIFSVAVAILLSGCVSNYSSPNATSSEAFSAEVGCEGSTGTGFFGPVGAVTGQSAMVECMKAKGFTPKWMTTNGSQ
jgi:PBP1b-binding outer membrane lipoprotein LpoB